MVLIASLADVQKVQDQSKIAQFFMKLQSEYEAIQSNLINRDPALSKDVFFGELLHKEQCLR